MKRVLVSLTAWMLVLSVNAELVIYPSPQSERLSDDYIVEVNGRNVPVYQVFGLLFRFLRRRNG